MPSSWHHTDLQKIIAALGTDPKRGLGTSEASLRKKKFGENILPRGKKTHWWQFLLRQFRSPLVYILVVAALLTGWLKEWVDMAVITASVIVNVSVGFWQEFRSSNILAKLQSYVHPSALVLRDAATKEIDATDLVPGDIIVLKTGMQVPADARIVSASHLELDEAVLTGESVPVGKSPEARVEDKAVIGDRKNMVHMGTTVARGEGLAVVVATGAKTELGTIALLTAKTDEEETPLQKRIGKLGEVLTVIVAASALIIFGVGLLEDHSFVEMFTTAVAVAVAAIPEGLPAAISIVLAVSAQRILRRRGVVKKLIAAETLGSATVICADKTGTLTEGKMVVERLVTEGSDDRARLVLACANEASVEKPGKPGDAPKITGEITDQAKMRAYFAAGGTLEDADRKYPRRSLLPFDPSKKYIASLHHDTVSGGHALFVSGAPETVLSLSTYVRAEGGSRTMTEHDRHRISRAYEQLAGNGFRTIALAERVLGPRDAVGSGDLMEEGTVHALVQSLSFIGLAALRDPIRSDVKESMAIAREAGIRVIMLTGDHVLTAQAIGGELGFASGKESVLSGEDIDVLSEEALAARIRSVEICARVSPEHKLRIVHALENHGEVVAMTGDGVNDAPALKTADIGVALGSGTDVAKEASDLILLDNSFSTIVAAIRQGRIAFDNIRKVTVFLLVQSFTEVLLVLGALIFRIPLPLTAVMILWMNLVEDALPNIALSFEPGEGDVMKRPPLKKNEPILDKPSRVIVFAIGLMTDVILLTAFVVLDLYSHLSHAYLQTMIFAAVGLDSFFYIYAVKSLRQPIWKTSFTDNPYLTGATLFGICTMIAAIYVPFLNHVLGTEPLHLLAWVAILIFGAIKIVGVEIVKWLFVDRARSPHSESPSPLLGLSSSTQNY